MSYLSERGDLACAFRALDCRRANLLKMAAPARHTNEKDWRFEIKRCGYDIPTSVASVMDSGTL